MTEEDYIDQVDSGTEELEQAGEDITTRTRWFARLLLTSLMGIAIAGFTVAVHYDYFVFQFVLNAEVNVGWMVEYFVGGMMLLVILFIGTLVLVAMPFSFWSSVVSGAARIADAYQLPEKAGVQPRQYDDEE